uniref:Testis expressed 9 n=1 Tax=Neolamprologus brichardi TaxID=32507 RepID=A0A3Q4MJV0_NEOBR
MSLQDDENTKLSAKIKELEEDRARLQKTVSIQQTQIEKHRALAAESNKKCDGLQLEEIENLNRSHKQAAAVHSTVEVRLNRALEEVERLKTQLNKMKQEKKMHFEAAKLLSFTEEEFMKALDWGK